MEVRISRSAPALARIDGLVIPLAKGDRVPRFARAVDATLGGAVRAALERGDFSGKRGETLQMPAEGVGAGRVLLLGLGEEGGGDAEVLRRAAAGAVRAVAERRGSRAGLLVPPGRRPAAAEVGQALAEGALLGGYRFDKYRTLESPPTPLKSLDLFPPDAAQAGALRAGARVGAIVAESTNFARDLSNEPGSVHTPAWLAQQARKLGREVGLRVRIFDQRELERRRMGGILAVGRGSANPPRMIVLEHNAPARGRPRRRTVALVGKGITFDTGGISIKPAASMEEMKHDMSGGAAVMGALRAAALLDLPLRVVGVVAAAQNSPGGRAYLPGDVVRTASGKTIEVVNTDAEGRIVLADGLFHAQSFRPEAIVDLATLTGACIIALGRNCAGLMGNDEPLQRRLRAASDETQERVWPLPLWDEHKKAIESHIADIKNTSGREAASITAAAFLSHFVGDMPWAHLDIAGNESTRTSEAYCVKGATGFGVRLLVALLRHWR